MANGDYVWTLNTLVSFCKCIYAVFISYFFPIYYHLTVEYAELTNESKKRYTVSVDVLGNEIIRLVECYANSLVNSAHLQSTIKLLKNTSALIDIFRDRL